MQESNNINEHLRELKTRLLYSILFLFLGILVSYHYAEDIFSFLLVPLQNVVSTEHKIIYTGLTEAFFTYLRLSISVGFCLSFPFIALQFYMFIAPGLYKNEKIILVTYLIISPILFLLGFALVYYFIFPLAWKFFLGFETSKNINLPIYLEARVSEYLSLVMQLIIAFGLSFQMPIIFAVLTNIGLINAQFMRNNRKYSIVIIFIIAAILTPPDVISQICLALPMILLYEISIFLCSNKDNNT